MRVVITVQAEYDLDQIVNYLLDRDPAAAFSVYDAITEQVRSLVDFPYRTRQGRIPGTRELVISNYPYIVVYEIVSDEIIILHVNHSRMQWPPES
jgi:toxin ParE1/3/4